MIDCAPVGMVIDAAIIAKSSDAAILVIESGEIKRKLAVEAREKLDLVRPINLGQASRISGVSPADISVLIIYLEQKKHEGKGHDNLE